MQDGSAGDCNVGHGDQVSGTSGKNWKGHLDI